MITEIQGLPPIVIQDLPELQNNVKKGMEGSLPDTSQNVANPMDLIMKPIVDKQKLNDFSELSEMAQDALQDSNLAVEFSMDKSTKKMIMKLINSKTEEIVYQYPPEIALKIARIVANTLETGNVTNAKF